MDKLDRKRILLKVGSNVLTNETNRLSIDKLKDIASQVDALRKEYEVIIVSSGSVAVAKQFTDLEGKEISVKQALAAIGQPLLMHFYQNIFKEYDILTSQCLLSYADFEKEETRNNIKNTINVLVSNKYMPVINENDTVATDEIKFGDNDKLGALTAELLNADILMIATNTDGVYTKESFEKGTPETIKETNSIEDLKTQIGESISLHGTGGMTTKIAAAEIAQQANIETWIVNGLKDNFILDALENKTSFTKITNK